MKHFARTVRQVMLAMLLASVGLAAGSGLRAGAASEAAPGLPAHQQPVAGKLKAQDIDAPLPFLAGSGMVLSAPLDLPTRLARGAQPRAMDTRRAGPADRAHDAAATALHVRRANRDHAAVARALAVARVGRTETRRTPPPHSAS